MLEPAAREELQRDLARLADGDRAAFDPVFARLWPLFRNLAARHLPSGDAEDAAQRALLRLFERASDFDPSRDALAWAVGLAAWEIRTARRRNWRRRETSDGDGEVERLVDESSPEDAAIAADLAALLGKTLATLRPPDVEALLRHARDERIAGVGFRKRLQRARERMRAAWRQRYG
jgi:RNA polymerase sigma-70 factor (ECF subfamily)